MGRLAEQLKKHFEETSQEELDKEWESMKHLNEIGPDVIEYTKRVKETLFDENGKPRYEQN